MCRLTACMGMCRCGSVCVYVAVPSSCCVTYHPQVKAPLSKIIYELTQSTHKYIHMLCMKYVCVWVAAYAVTKRATSKSRIRKQMSRNMSMSVCVCVLYTRTRMHVCTYYIHKPAYMCMCVCTPKNPSGACVVNFVFSHYRFFIKRNRAPGRPACLCAL